MTPAIFALLLGDNSDTMSQMNSGGEVKMNAEIVSSSN
eukprot:CAMPEP_0194209088 /NCGR_PEP_ID=MMETSP0156-20130528/7336_1 /TAXON_ID=33649 /ORGANISM="Thalassionema nitzschioides, Strain L26-B" /LENGTH=37 /DNA_ID= /DNA_START= /DNA_END= /DNA_ORIENTATION=